ncbi:unnamed protein product [Spirodela intermedia]|uniref:Protein kinase domain-containing protein n=1 Tax=Spirodela intermedia TaxID=51605 RepID=A0A7I8KB42_SPIIN|nr:unnamed protein product [Spirodela intermedia]
MCNVLVPKWLCSIFSFLSANDRCKHVVLIIGRRHVVRWSNSANYRSTKPTSYSYGDIMKIIKRFRHKLSQGGFGSVYRGELPNGVPIVVKMLHKYLGDMNLSTKWPRLAGFITPILLSFWKSLSGYLHQGCNKRILHFDIKAHNILLGPHLNPKISDFGLTKLCSKDYSRVTVTMVKGTMGYIALEMYSINFGTVSGRKTIDPSMETNSQVHVPEQIYGHLVRDEELPSILGFKGDQEIARKLTIVGLWCIWWKPNDRPSMMTIVQMLPVSSQSIWIPPTPFVSFCALGDITNLSQGNL